MYLHSWTSEYIKSDTTSNAITHEGFIMSFHRLLIVVWACLKIAVHKSADDKVHIELYSYYQHSIQLFPRNLLLKRIFVNFKRLDFWVDKAR